MSSPIIYPDDSIQFYEENDEDVDYERMSMWEDDVWVNCVALTMLAVAKIVFFVFIANMSFGMITQTGIISKAVFHMTSGLFGLFLIGMCYQTNEGRAIILGVFVISYILLIIFTQIVRGFNLVNTHFNLPNVVKFSFIAGFVASEYLLTSHGTWLSIRGTLMIFAMKIISISEEIHCYRRNVIGPVAYFGYVLNCSTLIFGPWISFDTYVALFERTPTKNIYWWIAVMKAIGHSIFFLTISNCWANYFIGDATPVIFQAYRAALSYRTSHYFISYLSEASMVTAGYKDKKIWAEPKQWRFVVSKPWTVEFPTALTVVVKNWNRPMHEFLKTYVFVPVLPKGRFFAILSTFVMSSFLHGFEKKISVILIVLGILSYVQYKVRDAVSDAFDACLRVYPCKKCTHKNKRRHFPCILALGFFSICTVFHLIFVGLIMDPSTNEVGIYEKWNQVNFYSLWIILMDIVIINV